MRIDWQSLAPNPWFQICALVAVLSGGTTIYNLTEHPGPPGGGGGGDGPLTPTPPPISITTPPPVPTLHAKTHGHWIVDANGASDADSRDLRTVVGNVADGDTVTLRAGSYQGGFNVGKSVHFIGEGANVFAVAIHASDQDAVTVSGKGVSFENLSITVDTPGDQLHALHCIGESHVELNRSLIHSKALYAAFVGANASLDARDSSFQTESAGCGVDFENNGHGSLLRCTFSSNRWGLQALNSARVQVTSCNFQNNGALNGDGTLLVLQGEHAQIDADQCQFTNNTCSMRVSESGSLSIANSSFKNNGVTGEQGNVSNGVISVSSSAKATLSNVTFESNKQGISVENAASVTISGCRFSNTGIHTENASFQYLCNPIAVTGRGSSATVNQGTAISNSTMYGIVIVQGAKLTLDDASVEGSGIDGLYVGNTDGGAMADVRRGKFVRNGNGIVFGFGSTGNIQDCQFIGNTTCGVSMAGANTKGTVVKSVFRGNKNFGLWIGDLAEGQATGCTFDGNDRGAQAGVTEKPDERGTMTLDNCTITNSSIFGVGVCVKSTLILRGMRYGGNPNPNVVKDRGGIVREDFRNMLVK